MITPDKIIEIFCMQTISAKNLNRRSKNTKSVMAVGKDDGTALQ
jgi:hypothetical protein